MIGSDSSEVVISTTTGHSARPLASPSIHWQCILAALLASLYLSANYYTNQGTIGLQVPASQEQQQATKVALTNVAIGKYAVQSSTFKNHTALLAIDGKLDTFSHSSGENAWLEIDLQQEFQLESVRLFNRWCGDPKDAPKCLCRLTGANLTLISGGSVVATELIGDTCKLHEVELIFGAIPAVQKVKIRSTTGEQIQLFEVELLSVDVTNVIKNNGDPDGSNATSSANATFESPSSQMAMFNGTESHNTEATAAVVNSDLNNTIDITNISTADMESNTSLKVSGDFTRCQTIDPNPVCKLQICRQKDPPGVALLQGHRGLSEMINWRGCMLAYLLIPKSGSTTVRTTLRNNALKSEMIFLTPNDKKYNPYTITFLRDPGERIASAYSTIVARFRGSIAHRAPDFDHFFPARPKNITDLSAWTRNFKESIHFTMSKVKEVGWENPKWIWNEHIPPQTEFMRGVNFAYIGCIESMEDALRGLGLNTTLPSVESNAYQHSDNMPKQKFGSFEMLDDETKALIREVYREDYELYESICKN